MADAPLAQNRAFGGVIDILEAMGIEYLIWGLDISYVNREAARTGVSRDWRDLLGKSELKRGAG